MKHTFSRLMAVLAAGYIAILAHPAAAQYTPLGCTWSQSSSTVTSVPVYFNPGTLSTNGFDVDEFRGALINAMAVWNEESRSQLDFYYAGDTTDGDGIPGAILINHLSTWSCADTSLAKAFFASSGDCRLDAGPLVHVILRDTCTGAVRPWRTTWPSAGEIGYEGVMVHELGHMLAMPDVSTSVGVMNAAQTEAGSELHLYPIDQASAVITASGLTHRRPVTLSSAAGFGFGAPSFITPPGYFSAAGPTLHQSGDAATGLRAGFFDQGWQMAGLRQGRHNTWSAISSPSNGSFLDVHSWVSVARSNGDNELMVAWPTACTRTTHCRINWAVTNDSGASWTTGTIPGTSTSGTLGRVELAYDQARDRFVMAYVNGDSARIFMTSTLATTSPVWSTPNAASKSGGSVTERFRYMGGLVFHPSTGVGLMTAGSNQTVGTGVDTPGIILQMSTSFASGIYTLSWSFWANSLAPLSYVTRRHLGLAYNSASNLVVLAWRGPSATRAFVTATKSSLSPSTAFGAPSEELFNVINSVDAAWSPSTNTIVGGVSWL